MIWDHTTQAELGLRYFKKLFQKLIKLKLYVLFYVLNWKGKNNHQVLIKMHLFFFLQLFKDRMKNEIIYTIINKIALIFTKSLVGISKRFFFFLWWYLSLYSMNGVSNILLWYQVHIILQKMNVAWINSCRQNSGFRLFLVASCSFDKK